MYYKITLIFLILINIFTKTLSAPDFTIKWKIYDFKASQPGFNISYEEFSKIAKTAPKSGMVKTQLNPITHKPQYCCGDNSFSYMPNEKVFDQCFVDSDASKSISANTDFYKAIYTDGKVQYKSTQKFYYPANGRGWNDMNPNLYWCMEAHYEFKLKSLKDQMISVQFDGDRFIYINGEIVMENINIDSSISVFRMNGLEVNKIYPLDIFLCQRFDQYKPSKMLAISTSFIAKCVNIPGVNDDVCPKERLPCVEKTDCNDDDKCTIDKCPPKDISIPSNETYSKYCSHQPIQCLTSNKCLESLGCNKDTGSCETKSISCSDNIQCTTDSCDPNKGCVYTPQDSLCDDGDPCTIDKCTATGCVSTPMECNGDPNNKCISSSCVNGKCVDETKTCPPKRSLLSLLCENQKCNPSDGQCVKDGPSKLLYC